MNRMKLNVMMVAFAMVFVAFAGCLGADDDVIDDVIIDDTVTTIKIGLLNPATGPIAVYASGFEDAANVAIEKLNMGDSNITFELVVADSGCDGTQAATAAQTLVDAGVIGIAGAACSGATLGAIAVASAAGIPMVSYASTSPAVTTADDDGFLFRVVPSDAQQAVALATVVAGSSATNPGVIYMTNDYGAGLGDNFNASWTGGVCTMVGYDPTEGSYDAATLAGAVVDAGCDSAVLMSYATDGAAIMEALSAQSFTGSVFGADGLADSAFGDAFNDLAALDGLVATKPRPGAASDAKATFDAAYTAAGGDAGGIYTHETYDAVNIIGKAAKMVTNSMQGSDMKSALAMVGNDYDGASGSHTFDSNGDVLGTGYSICGFVLMGDTMGFSCPSMWTADAGVTAAPFEGTTIKIGLLSPQTGPIAVYSGGFDAAAAIAIQALNLLDSDNYQFELVIADSGCDGTQAATAAQTLIDSGVAAIAGAACSGATLGAIAVAKEAGIPMISYASTSPAVSSADDNNLLYRVVSSDALQGPAIADVVTDANYTNAAILYMTNDYGAGLYDAISGGLSSTCTASGYDPTEGSYDAATLAQSVIDASCDSVILVSYATDGAAIVGELAGLGFTGGVFGADGIADAGFISEFTDNSSLDGIVATKPASASDSARRLAFDAAWISGGGPDGAIYTHETFDAVLIAGLAAMAMASTPEITDIVTALSLTGNNFDGASGMHTFDANGDVAGNGYSICSFSHDGTDASFSCDRTWLDGVITVDA
ncbi:MAG: hypothetical protein CXX81_21600 [Methanobacteriota archaeon]|nr:MAG: hypothetical protein CXX81_21600 [Euryarchaeota archaeon]